MSNDKKKRRIILLIIIALIIINLLVFGILFIDLWAPKPKKENKDPIIEDTGLHLSSDGTILIDDITYKQKSDGSFMVFSCNKSIESVEIRDKINDDEIVNEIGEKAFEDCSNINNILIPATITKISSYAFSGCRQITTITIPYGVTEIGDSIFYGCDNLNSIKVNVSNENFSAENGVLYDKDGKKLYAYPHKKTNESYKLSDSLESIENEVFRGFENLKSVALPESVKTIGKGAFEECKNLEKVYLLKNVTSIGEDAFKGCSEGLTIYGESGSYAEKYAKENNFKFEEITVE